MCVSIFQTIDNFLAQQTQSASIKETKFKQTPLKESTKYSSTELHSTKFHSTKLEFTPRQQFQINSILQNSNSMIAVKLQARLLLCRMKEQC